MHCPRCKNPLAERSIGGVVVHPCAVCGGLYLDNVAGRKVVSAVDPKVVSASSEAASSARVSVAPVGTALCPECGTGMRTLVNRGVEIDVCEAHGAWFDRDELQRFVEAETARPAPAPSPKPQKPVKGPSRSGTTTSDVAANVGGEVVVGLLGLVLEGIFS